MASPVVKDRQTHWAIFLKPAKLLVMTRQFSRRIFEAPYMYLDTHEELQRKMNNMALFGVVTGIFIYFSTLIYETVDFLSISKFIDMPTGILFGITGTIVTLILGSFAKHILLKRIAKKAPEALNKEQLKSLNKGYKYILWAQALIIAVSFLANWVLGIQLYVVAIPEFIQVMLKGVPYLLFMSTWLLSMYSFNYLFMGMAEFGYNWRNNVYELNNIRDTKKTKARLLALLTDKTKGLYGNPKYPTRGEERAASFINVVVELTGTDRGYHLGQKDVDYVTPFLNKATLRDAVNRLIDDMSKPLTIPGHKPIEREFALLRIQKYINKQYRLDKGLEPLTKEEVLPLTVVNTGYGEDFFYTKDQLFKFASDANTKDLMHRIGMLAQYKRELYVTMVLNIVPKHEQDEFWSVIKNPLYIPKNISELTIEKMEIWANTQLPTVWSNTRSNQLVLNDIYSYYARMFDVEKPQEWVHSKVRVINRLLMGLHELNNVLGDKLREIVDVLVETDYQHTMIVDSTTQTVRGMAEDKINELLAKNLSQQKLFELIRHDRVIPVRLYGGGVSTDFDKAENYHGAKWNQKTAIMPYLLGPVLLNLDADHRVSYSGMESVVAHILEYYYQQSLAVTTPVVNHEITRNLGPIGKVIPVGENAFYFHTQQGKMLFGGIGAYGKLFERVSALRHAEGLTDSYVAEDFMTVVRYMSFGYTAGRAGYIEVEKGWPYQFREARNPLRKWSYDSFEIVSGRSFIKLALSKYVSWTYLVNNFVLDGVGFYLKKVIINRYFKWLVVFVLMFDWNVFSGVPLALWIGGMLLSQAISYGLVFYNVYDLGKGWTRGTWHTLKSMPRMYVFYLYMVWMYDETIKLLASSLLGQFVNTGNKSGNIFRDLIAKLTYINASYVIQQGAFWSLVILFYVGFHPIKFFLWLPVVFMPVVAVVASFWFNPKTSLNDWLFDAKNAVKAFGWGLMDMVLKAEQALRLGKADQNIQKTILAAGVKVDAKDDYVKWLEYFHQYPSHHARLYGRAPLPLVLKVADNAAEKLNEQTINVAQATKGYDETQLKDYLKSLKDMFARVKTYVQVNDFTNVSFAAIDADFKIAETTQDRTVLERLDWNISQLETVPHALNAKPATKRMLADIVFNKVSGPMEILVLVTAYYVIILQSIITVSTSLARLLLKGVGRLKTTTQEKRSHIVNYEEPTLDQAPTELFENETINTKNADPEFIVNAEQYLVVDVSSQQALRDFIQARAPSALVKGTTATIRGPTVALTIETFIPAAQEKAMLTALRQALNQDLIISLRNKDNNEVGVATTQNTTINFGSIIFTIVTEQHDITHLVIAYNHVPSTPLQDVILRRIKVLFDTLVAKVQHTLANVKQWLLLNKMRHAAANDDRFKDVPVQTPALRIARRTLPSNGQNKVTVTGQKKDIVSKAQNIQGTRKPILTRVKDALPQAKYSVKLRESSENVLKSFFNSNIVYGKHMPHFYAVRSNATVELRIAGIQKDIEDALREGIDITLVTGNKSIIQAKWYEVKLRHNMVRVVIFAPMYAQYIKEVIVTLPKEQDGDNKTLLLAYDAPHKVLDIPAPGVETRQKAHVEAALPQAIEQRAHLSPDFFMDQVRDQTRQQLAQIQIMEVNDVAAFDRKAFAKALLGIMVWDAINALKNKLILLIPVRLLSKKVEIDEDDDFDFGLEEEAIKVVVQAEEVKMNRMQRIIKRFKEFDALDPHRMKLEKTIVAKKVSLIATGNQILLTLGSASVIEGIVETMFPDADSSEVLTDAVKTKTGATISILYVEVSEDQRALVALKIRALITSGALKIDVIGVDGFKKRITAEQVSFAFNSIDIRIAYTGDIDTIKISQDIRSNVKREVQAFKFSVLRMYDAIKVNMAKAKSLLTKKGATHFEISEKQMGTLGNLANAQEEHDRRLKDNISGGNQTAIAELARSQEAVDQARQLEIKAQALNVNAVDSEQLSHDLQAMQQIIDSHLKVNDLSQDLNNKNDSPNTLKSIAGFLVVSSILTLFAFTFSPSSAFADQFKITVKSGQSFGDLIVAQGDKLRQKDATQYRNSILSKPLWGNEGAVRNIYEAIKNDNPGLNTQRIKVGQVIDFSNLYVTQHIEPNVTTHNNAAVQQVNQPTERIETKNESHVEELKAISIAADQKNAQFIASYRHWAFTLINLLLAMGSGLFISYVVHDERKKKETKDTRPIEWENTRPIKLEENWSNTKPLTVAAEIRGAIIDLYADFLKLKSQMNAGQMSTHHKGYRERVLHLTTQLNHIENAWVTGWKELPRDKRHSVMKDLSYLHTQIKSFALPSNKGSHSINIAGMASAQLLYANDEVIATGFAELKRDLTTFVAYLQSIDLINVTDSELRSFDFARHEPGVGIKWNEVFVNGEESVTELLLQVFTLNRTFEILEHIKRHEAQADEDTAIQAQAELLKLLNQDLRRQSIMDITREEVIRNFREDTTPDHLNSVSFYVSIYNFIEDKGIVVIIRTLTLKDAAEVAALQKDIWAATPSDIFNAYQAWQMILNNPRGHLVAEIVRKKFGDGTYLGSVMWTTKVNLDQALLGKIETSEVKGTIWATLDALTNGFTLKGMMQEGNAIVPFSTGLPFFNPTFMNETRKAYYGENFPRDLSKLLITSIREIAIHDQDIEFLITHSPESAIEFHETFGAARFNEGFFFSSRGDMRRGVSMIYVLPKNSKLAVFDFQTREQRLEALKMARKLQMINGWVYWAGRWIVRRFQMTQLQRIVVFFESTQFSMKKDNFRKKKDGYYQIIVRVPFKNPLTVGKSIIAKVTNIEESGHNFSDSAMDRVAHRFVQGSLEYELARKFAQATRDLENYLKEHNMLPENVIARSRTKMINGVPEVRWGWLITVMNGEDKTEVILRILTEELPKYQRLTEREALIFIYQVKAHEEQQEEDRAIQAQVMLMKAQQESKEILQLVRKPENPPTVFMKLKSRAVEFIISVGILLALTYLVSNTHKDFNIYILLVPFLVILDKALLTKIFRYFMPKFQTEKEWKNSLVVAPADMTWMQHRKIIYKIDLRKGYGRKGLDFSLGRPLQREDQHVIEQVRDYFKETDNTIMMARLSRLMTTRRLMLRKSDVFYSYTWQGKEERIVISVKEDEDLAASIIRALAGEEEVLLFQQWRDDIRAYADTIIDETIIESSENNDGVPPPSGPKSTLNILISANDDYIDTSSRKVAQKILRDVLRSFKISWPEGVPLSIPLSISSGLISFTPKFFKINQALLSQKDLSFIQIAAYAKKQNLDLEKRFASPDRNVDPLRNAVALYTTVVPYLLALRYKEKRKQALLRALHPDQIGRQDALVNFYRQVLLSDFEKTAKDFINPLVAMFGLDAQTIMVLHNIQTVHIRQEDDLFIEKPDVDPAQSSWVLNQNEKTKLNQIIMDHQLIVDRLVEIETKTEKTKRIFVEERTLAEKMLVQLIENNTHDRDSLIQALKVLTNEKIILVTATQTLQDAMSAWINSLKPKKIRKISAFSTETTIENNQFNAIVFMSHGKKDRARIINTLVHESGAIAGLAHETNVVIGDLAEQMYRNHIESEPEPLEHHNMLEYFKQGQIKELVIWVAILALMANIGIAGRLATFNETALATVFFFTSIVGGLMVYSSVRFQIIKAMRHHKILQTKSHLIARAVATMVHLVLSAWLIYSVFGWLPFIAGAITTAKGWAVIAGLTYSFIISIRGDIKHYQRKNKDRARSLFELSEEQVEAVHNFLHRNQKKISTLAKNEMRQSVKDRNNIESVNKIETYFKEMKAPSNIIQMFEKGQLVIVHADHKMQEELYREIGHNNPVYALNTIVLTKKGKRFVLILFPEALKSRIATEQTIVYESVVADLNQQNNRTYSQRRDYANRYVSYYKNAVIRYKIGIFNAHSGAVALLKKSIPHLRELFKRDQRIDVLDVYLRQLTQPSAINAVRALIYVLEDNRLHPELWGGILTKENFKILVIDPNSQDWQIAQKGRFHIEYFKTQEPGVFIDAETKKQKRFVDTETSELLERYFVLKDLNHYELKEDFRNFLQFQQSRIEDFKLNDHQKFALIIMQAVEFKVEVEHDPNQPFATVLIANEVPKWMRPKGMLITTAQKWFHEIIQLEKLYAGEVNLAFMGLSNVPVYAYQHNSQEHTKAYFRSRFDQLLAHARSYRRDINEAMLIKAFDLALEQHFNEKRSDEQRYITHLLDVMGIILNNRVFITYLKELNVRLDNVLAASLLHDWVESRINDLMLNRNQSQNIEDLVELLSVVNGAEAQDIAFMVDVVTKRKGESDADFIHRMRRSLSYNMDRDTHQLMLAAIGVIKVADSIANLKARADRTALAWLEKMNRRRDFVLMLPIAQGIKDLFINLYKQSYGPLLNDIIAQKKSQRLKRGKKKTSRKNGNA